MFQFLGLDFLSGENSLRSAPTEVNKIQSTKLSNAVIDHFNVTRDLGLYGDKVPFDGWTYETILNASFDGDTNAGNLEYVVGQINGIKIKRRKKGEFDWITLDFILIDGVEDLNFVFKDFLNAYGTEYEYAFVPVINNDEGEYIMDSIMSKFSGVFIGDANQAIRFLYNTSYGGIVRNQQVGVFAPLGREYPIIVANGLTNYDSGSFSGMALDDEFENTGTFDRLAIVKKVNEIKDFLSDKKPKILKDWNGNIFLVAITDSPQVTYANGSAMGIANVEFNWTEIGDVNDEEQLYDNGMIGGREFEHAQPYSIKRKI